MSSFNRDLFSVGISKIVIIIFSLVRGIILARWLGPEANGTIAALLIYPSLFMSFGSLGISQSTTFLIGRSEYPENIIKTSITQIWFFTTVLSMILSFLLIYNFSNSGDKTIMVLLAIAPIPFTLFNTYNSGIFLGKNQISNYNRINWLPIAIDLLFVLLLVIIIPLGIQGAMLASVMGTLSMSLFLLLKYDLLSAFTFNLKLKAIKHLLTLGIVYATSLLVINLNYKADVILLDKLSTPFELGIYAKGVAITEYLWQIPMLLSTIVFARSANSKNGLLFSQKVAQLLRLSFVAIGLGSVVLVLLARYVILIMYGVEFTKSTEVLQLLMPGVMLLTIFKVLNMDLAGKGKPWISMKAMLPAVILNIVLNLILIPVYGSNGSAISSTVSYSVAAILFLHFYSKETMLSIKEILRYTQTDFVPLKNIVQKILKRN